MPGSFLLTAYKINLNDPKDCGPFHRVHLESWGFQTQRYHQCSVLKDGKVFEHRILIDTMNRCLHANIGPSTSKQVPLTQATVLPCKITGMLMGCRFSAETMSLGKVAPTVRQLFSHRGMEGLSKLANLMWAMTRPLSNFPAQANACCSRDHIFKKTCWFHQPEWLSMWNAFHESSLHFLTRITGRCSRFEVFQRIALLRSLPRHCMPPSVSIIRRLPPEILKIRTAAAAGEISSEQLGKARQISIWPRHAETASRSL